MTDQQWYGVLQRPKTSKSSVKIIYILCNFTNPSKQDIKNHRFLTVSKHWQDGHRTGRVGCYFLPSLRGFAHTLRMLAWSNSWPLSPTSDTSASRSAASRGKSWDAARAIVNRSLDSGSKGWQLVNDKNGDNDDQNKNDNNNLSLHRHPWGSEWQ